MIKLYQIVEAGLTELKAKQLLIDYQLQHYINKYNYTSTYKPFTFKLYKSIKDNNYI